MATRSTRPRDVRGKIPVAADVGAGAVKVLRLCGPSARLSRRVHRVVPFERPCGGGEIRLYSAAGARFRGSAPRDGRGRRPRRDRVADRHRSRVAGTVGRRHGERVRPERRGVEQLYARPVPADLTHVARPDSSSLRLKIAGIVLPFVMNAPSAGTAIFTSGFTASTSNASSSVSSTRGRLSVARYWTVWVPVAEARDRARARRPPGVPSSVDAILASRRGSRAAPPRSPAPHSSPRPTAGCRAGSGGSRGG
jgi:hypothetical protein